jgi:hypothetical protein
MWDAIISVGPYYSPIIHEGEIAATVIVQNVGPGFVRLRCWKETQPTDPTPLVDLELHIGDTRSVSGKLIRLLLMEPKPHPYPPPAAGAPPAAGWPFPVAAVGWRVIR